MYLHQAPRLGSFGATPTLESLINTLWFVVVDFVREERNGRIVMTPKWRDTMSPGERAKFIARFLAPMHRYELSRGLLAKINADPKPVHLAWGNGKFGVTGTVALDRPNAMNRTGSGALVFIDEQGSDWRGLPTIVANPDVGLFHELVHVRQMQRGIVVDDEEEMERRAIGLGPYMNVACTENGYRRVRNLDRRNSRKKEPL